MESEKVEANKNLTRVPLCAKGKRYLPKNPAANGCHGYDGREGRQALYGGKKGRWKIRVEIVCVQRGSQWGKILNATRACTRRATVGP